MWTSLLVWRPAVRPGNGASLRRKAAVSHKMRTDGSCSVGGLLLCPTCGGHFEAVSAPWKNATPVYVCATRRRKPGVCTNTLALPIADTDDAVLDMVEGEALGTRFIEELLALVDKGEADNSALHMADLERLRNEIANLVNLAASGVSDETTVPAIKEREREMRQLEARLRQPRPVQPKIDELRAAALEQRAAEWRVTLRAEPQVARLLLRRLIGPLTMWDAAEPLADEWAASLTPALLEGLAPAHLLASPTGFEPVFWP
jgi:recombinase-like zinc beta ribbon protein